MKGFKIDSSDPDVLHAMKVSRLAQLHRLRDLQTCINECIVAMQQVTSNPKTDTKLGKVGFWLSTCINEIMFHSNCIVFDDCILYLRSMPVNKS